MSPDPQDQEGPPAKRGDAAWREQLQAVAARNEAAKKAGKQRREEYERSRAATRHAAQRRLDG